MTSSLARFRQLRRGLPLLAAGLLLVALALPMWRITLTAPQYPGEALLIELYAYPRMGGDYAEVHALNKYVGFYYPDPVYVEPNFPVHERSIRVPEWVLGPVAFVAVAAAGVFVSLAPTERKLKLGLTAQLVGTVATFTVMFALIQYRLYQAGHSLDPDAPLRGVEEFTPPVLGGYEVANISGFAWFGPGGYLTLLAVALLVVGYLARDTDATFADLPALVRGLPGAVRELPVIARQLPAVGRQLSAMARLLPAVARERTAAVRSRVETLVAETRRGGHLAVRRASRRLETAFPLVVAAMLVATAVAPFAMAAPAPAEEESFDLDVDRAHSPPSVPEEATARVGDRTFEGAQAAIDAADPGDTVVLEGRFDERLTVNASDVTLTTERGAVVDGGGEGRVLTVAGENVTVEGLWLRNSGYDVGDEDAGVFVAGSADRTTLRGLYLSEITFGVWIDGADEVTVEANRIEGREDVERRTDRGNGVQLWETEDTEIRGNEITDVRDGIYYSWASGVVSANNTMWDTRYGVHFMYSDDNRLANNTAVDNDVGFALMVSDGLVVENNTAARNDGTSGHGVLLKDIERSTVRGNTLVENANGLYVYNTQDSRLEGNLLLRNGVGIHSTADSRGQSVVGNSFVHNDDAVVTTTKRVQAWNGTDRGNYWSGARTADLDGDGVSEVRHRPAGMVEHVVAEHPQAAVFADSPAFDAVRLAESSFPVVEAPGVVDRHPLVEPPHDWRNYADTR